MTEESNRQPVSKPIRRRTVWNTHSPLALIGAIVIVVVFTIWLIGIFCPPEWFRINSGISPNAMSFSRLQQISDGVRMYVCDHNILPGTIEGTSSTTRGTVKQTGSELLVKAMFADKDGKLSTYGYAVTDKFMTFKGVENLIGDSYYKPPMPILYYLARRQGNLQDRFDEADNEAITNGCTGGEFRSFLSRRENSVEGGGMSHEDKSFMLIAAGKDRLYFTDDDLMIVDGFYYVKK